MRTIIAGSRAITSYTCLLEAIRESGFTVTSVVSGGTRGVDALGEAYARENNLECLIMCADWKAHGRAAGPIRNIEMTKKADALVAVWDGISKGTAHMIKEAERRGLSVYVHIVKNNKEEGL